MTVSLLDEAGRVILREDSEPAGGHRPMSGWAASEIVEDAWRLRLPRDVQRGKLHMSVGLVSNATGLAVPTNSGQSLVALPVEVTVE